MKRQILILGAGIMQVPLIRLAAQAGLRTLVFDQNPQAPGAVLADNFIPADISSQDECIAQARNVNRSEPIHGVITVGTDFSTTVAAIAEALDLPGHRLAAADLAKNKYRMRQAFRAAGVPSPDFLFWSTGSPFPSVHFSLPWVVKPADSMGARGVRLLVDAKDLPEALVESSGFSPTSTAIVEEFIPGREFSIDALVRNDQVCVHGLADRDIKFPPRFIEMGHSFPTRLTETEQQTLVRVFTQGIKALGLNWGAAKGDIKWHPEKGPMVGEIAARLSGGFMSGWTYPYSSGLSAISQAISLALGDEVDLQGSFGPGPVAERAVISAPGIIKEVHGLDKVSQIVGFKDLFLHKKSGDSVVFPKNNVEKVGNFLVAAPDSQRLESAVSQIYSLILVQLEPSQSQTTKWFSDAGNPSAFPENEETDYYGQSRDQVFQRFLGFTGADPLDPRLKDGDFWEYLQKGSLQGAVYYWDSFCLQPRDSGASPSR